MRRHAAEMSPAMRRVLGVGVALYLLKVVAIVAGRPLAEYPILFPDSFDWLTNGLFYAGVPLDMTGRWPLSPLIYSLFFRLHLENAIPLLGPLYLGLTALWLGTVGRRAMGDAAIFAAVLLATNHFVLPNALVVGSDMLAAGLAAAGLLAFLLALVESYPSWFLIAAALLALSLQAQVAAELLLPALLVLYCYAPEANPLRRVTAACRDRWLWTALLVAVLVPGLVFAWRWASGGAFFQHTQVDHAGLLGFSTANAGYYAWSCLALWSIPVTLLMVVGIVMGWRTRAERRVVLGLVLAIVMNALFFVLLYRWRDNRFVLYWTIPAFLLAGMGLAALPARARWVVFALTVVWSNLTHVAEATGFNVAVVWAPGHAAVMDYFSGAITPDKAPAGSYTRILRGYLKERAEAIKAADGDDIYISRDRQLTAELAATYVPPAGRIYFQVGRDESAVSPYLLRNELILNARRSVRLTRIDVTSPYDHRPPKAVVILRRGELDRLQALGWQFKVLEQRRHYAVVRVVAPPG